MTRNPDLKAVAHELRGLPAPMRRKMLAEARRYLAAERAYLAGRPLAKTIAGTGTITITITRAANRPSPTPPRTRRRPS